MVLPSVLFILSGQAWAGAELNAIVDASGTSEGLVYATISEALKAAPAADNGPYRILIRKGVYREKLHVTRPDVHLLGEDRDESVISWDDTGSTPGPDGRGLGTWGSATLIISASGFRAENLTVENAFDYPANRALPADDPGRIEHMQAVALMTTGESDRAVFKNVTIRGYQDTLFIDAGRHWFHGCRIEGHVDFIFGAGQAVFEKCDIVSLNRVNKNPTGYVTAPSTKRTDAYGFLFLHSSFLKAAGVTAGSVRLGRPWHPGADPGVEGSAVFMHSFMDDHIGPEGYAPISSTNPAGEKVWFEVDENSRFFEYGNYGPGALASPRRPSLSEEQSGQYTASQVLDGWVPD